METFTIGRLAKKARVKVATIRYYERINLIPAPPRSRSGYREYPKDNIAYIQFIRYAKEMGFSLNEISDLLSLRCNPHPDRMMVRTLVRTQITSIDTKIEALQKIRKTLADLISLCDAGEPIDKCPILESMED